MSFSFGGIQPPPPVVPSPVGQTVSAAVSGSSLSLSDAQGPAASPPPDIVYEPTRTPEEGATLTYAPTPVVPQAGEGDGVDPALVAGETIGHAGPDVAIVASSGLRTQFGAGTLAEPVTDRTVASPPPAQGQQAVRAASATAPGLAQPTPTPVASDPQTPAQSTAQAVYALAADAAVQDSDVRDLIRFA